MFRRWRFEARVAQIQLVENNTNGSRVWDVLVHIKMIPTGIWNWFWKRKTRYTYIKCHRATEYGNPDKEKWLYDSNNCDLRPMWVGSASHAIPDNFDARLVNLGYFALRNKINNRDPHTDPWSDVKETQLLTAKNDPYKPLYSMDDVKD